MGLSIRKQQHTGKISITCSHARRDERPSFDKSLCLECEPHSGESWPSFCGERLNSFSVKGWKYKQTSESNIETV